MIINEVGEGGEDRGERDEGGEVVEEVVRERKEGRW